MTACVDPASEIVTVAMQVLREAYDPDGLCPPDPKYGGSTDVVRFFASDGGLPYWDANCKAPFLWVRVDRRYRSTPAGFPSATVADSPCGAGSIRVLAVEVGVARCSTADARPSWDKLATEAEIGLDDSWRIETALCGIVARLRTTTRAVATDTIAPVGPEGGVIAWTGMAYIQI